MIDFLSNYGFMICYFSLFWGAVACIALSVAYLDRQKPLLYGALLFTVVWVILTWGIAFVPRMTIPFK